MSALSPGAVAQYRRDGFYFPLRVLTPEAAVGYRARLEAVERERGGPLGGELRHKGHLLFTWLDELIRHPRILDAVEDILGPDLLCWSSSFFIKEARDPAFVSWHQDAARRHHAAAGRAPLPGHHRRALQIGRSTGPGRRPESGSGEPRAASPRHSRGA